LDAFDPKDFGVSDEEEEEEEEEKEEIENLVSPSTLPSSASIDTSAGEDKAVREDKEAWSKESSSSPSPSRGEEDSEGWVDEEWVMRLSHLISTKRSRGWLSMEERKECIRGCRRLKKAVINSAPAKSSPKSSSVGGEGGDRGDMYRELKQTIRSDAARVVQSLARRIIYSARGRSKGQVNRAGETYAQENSNSNSNSNSNNDDNNYYNNYNKNNKSKNKNDKEMHVNGEDNEMMHVDSEGGGREGGETVKGARSASSPKGGKVTTGRSFTLAGIDHDEKENESGSGAAFAGSVGSVDGPSNRNNGNQGAGNGLRQGDANTATNGSNSQSLTSLSERKKMLKAQLKKFDSDFCRERGRLPRKAEKEPIRHLYEQYNKLKGLLEKSMGVEGVEDANDSNHNRAGQGENSVGGTVNAHDSSKNAWGPVSAHQQRLRTEKHSLHLSLKKFERDFFARNGRQVSSFDDIKPVAELYRRYKTVKKELAKAGK